jgi:hypothetical protein
MYVQGEVCMCVCERAGGELYFGILKIFLINKYINHFW